MAEYSIVGGVLSIIIVLVSYKAFKEYAVMEENLFEVDAILIDKEYRRLITAGFVHVGWLHLLLNVGVLLSFAPVVEFRFGILPFLLLYTASLIGGNLLALFVHRNHGDYRAVGASGAISGVIFSYLVMFPDASISLVFIPIEFKAWIFGLAFVLISILGIKSQYGNIGHEAHLGGAIIGVLLTIVFEPSVVNRHPWVILGILGPAILFIVLIARNPEVMIIQNYWGEGIASFKSGLSNLRREEELSEEEELDYLLEKIRKKGIHSLTPKERERLDELSKQ